MQSNVMHPYVTAELAEVVGSYHIGLKIDVAVGRPLTKAEQEVIYKAHRNILEILKRESAAADPAEQRFAAEEKNKLLALFPSPIYVKPIPNEYGERMHCPWFLVTTNRGHIKIGWRRRVIEIDWSDTDIISEAADLFPTENVTKSGKSIHAWGYEKAKQYIDIILGAK